MSIGVRPMIFFSVSVALAGLFLLWGAPTPCRAQTSAKERVKTLYQEYRELEEQGRYREAIPYAEDLVRVGKKAFGESHSHVGLFLNNLAALYLALGDFGKAESLYRESLAIREKALGPRHPDVAQSLNNLGLIYYTLGAYGKAVPLYKRSLEILEEAYGPNSPEVVENLTALGVLYRELGDLSKAEVFSKRSLEIKERVLGPEHPQVAVSLNNLAVVTYMLGDYKEAERLYKRSLKIVERAYGSEDPEVAACLGNLAMLYSSAGDYEQAEALLKRSLKISEKALGPEHPDVATSLNNLGALYKALGEYDQAERMYERSLQIMERALGKEHPDLAKVLNNLGGFYLTFGQYAMAESCYKRSLEIKKKTFGPVHPSVALGLNNLGQVYKAVGDYGKAARLYERSVEISAKALGQGHPQVAYTLNNLGIIYRTVGDYEKAEALYNQCLTIEKAVYGPKHPRIALGLGNLAELDVARNRYSSAESAYKEALAIQKDAFGPEHPDVAKSLNNLALLYYTLGDYGKAEALFDESLALWKKAFGPQHPLVAGFLNNQAVLRAVQGDFETSHLLFKQLHKIDDDSIDQVIGFTSDEQKLRFLTMKQESLYCFISLVQQHLAYDMPARIDALNVWLRRKGLILEAQKRFQEALVYSEDVEAIKICQDLSRVRSQLSNLVFAGPGKKGLAVYNKRIADLRAQEEELEAKLSRVSQGFALKQKKAKADCEKVAGALPPHTALIEFAKVPTYNFGARGKETKWEPARYLVFILHAGKGERVGLVDLWRADAVDRAVAEFREEMSEPREVQGIKAALSCRKMHDLLFKPLKKELGEVKEVFISPDGTLNLIPFEVLQSSDGRYLIEDYTFNYLGAGRDLLGFGRRSGQSEKALLMGDPDFDMAEEKKTAAPRELPPAQGTERLLSKRSTEMEHFRFSRLPGTREEVEAIYALLGENRASLYTGRMAVEEVIQHCEGPAILHLATHGFFLKDLTPPALPGGSPYRGLQTVQVFATPAAAPIKIENPLHRSGLALAGANQTLRAGNEGQSEGIVTAEKILGLNLHGTDMVVLSACDTGVGEVKRGEGVFGLRRAFTQAGAKSLIMSMWSVPDKETKELMVGFYKNILSGERNRCQALREAALKQMATVKARYGHKNPFYWGGFVFMGEP